MRKQVKWSLVAVVTVALVAAPAVFAFNPNSDESLVGWWPLDEGEGSTAFDYSSNGNDGSLEGDAAWAEGILGGAISLDGDGDYIDLGNDSAFDLTDEITLAVWVNANDMGNGENNPWLGKGDTSYMLKGFRSGYDIEFFIYDSTWNSAHYEVEESFNGEWHHVAGTFNGSDVQIYVDGEDGGDTASASSINVTTYDVCIGVNSQHTDRLCEGLLDDARIYSRALTAEEILAVMTGGGNMAQASGPAPGDGEGDVALDATLTWSPGKGAGAHDVYFGTNAEDVNDASRSNAGLLVSQEQSGTSYTPTGLALDGAYYWRIDEVNTTDDTITKGIVWSFMAEPTYFDVVPVGATASSYDEVDDYNCPPDKTIDGSGLTNGLHSNLPAGMWRTVENDLVGAWIQYEFDLQYRFHQMHVWNYNGESEAFLGMGAKDISVSTSLDGENWTPLADVQLARAPGNATYAGEDVALSDVVAQYIRIEVVSQQGYFATGLPLIQQVGLSEVQFQAVPIAARRPSPTDGTTADSLFEELTWRLGRDAQESRLYVSTDANLVEAADESVLVATISGRRYSIADTGAQYDETYSWRVDEVYSDSVVAGPVWSFSTPEYLVIDDMESYTTTVGSRIFDVWIDGYGEDNGNGSIVGYDVADGPFTEREITFDGSGKSMPFEYEDEDGASAAWATLDLGGQDWSVGGLETLVVYFLGDVDNDEATFYVEVDGKRVESSKSLKSTLWQQLAVDIDTLNIDLTSVDEFIVGVEGAGVEGNLLIDEIRVCRDVHIAASPVDPGDDGLVVYYDMEDNVENQAGNAYDGIPNVTMFYSNDSANDDFGKSLTFDGEESEVNIPDLGGLISTLTSSSYSGWVSIDEEADGSWMRLFDFGSSVENYMFVSPRSGTSGEVRGAILTQAMSDAETDEAGVTSASPLVDGWHHLVMVIEEGDPNGLLTLYVDGWSAGTAETPGMPADLGETTRNWLGQSQWSGDDGSDDLYNGLMDEFRIYNRALSEGEVRYLAGDR